MSEPSRPEDPPGYQRVFEEVDHYTDVPMKITILLGNRRMKIREILELKQNSIVELSKSAGENVDIYVNGRLVGYGEVLEMEKNAGIRLTDLFTGN